MLLARLSIMRNVKKQSGRLFSDAKRDSGVKSKYGGIEASDGKRLKEPEEENVCLLKQMYAELGLTEQI